MSNKKILTIIGVVLAIFAVGFGVYFAWQKAKEIAAPSGGGGGVPSEYFGGLKGVQNISGIPSVAPAKEEKKEKLQLASDQPVFDYWTTGDILNKSAATTTAVAATSTALSDLSNQIFYFNGSGQIFKAVVNKEDEMISDRAIENLQSIKANKDGTMIIVKYGNLANPTFEIFDLGKKVWTILNNITAAAFSPDGNKIAYLENVGGGNSAASNLVIKDLAGKKPKTAKILSFNQKDFGLEWIIPDKIFLISKPSYLAEGEIWSASVSKKTLNLIISGNGLAVNWAKDGSLGLKMESNSKGKGSLNLIGSDGAVKANLGFFALPDKCFVSLAKIYCAIAQSRTSIAEPILPDNYLKRAVYYTDYLYGIDVPTNSFSLVFGDPNFNIDFSRLSLFIDNSLAFINRYDGKIYKLNL